MVTSMLADNLVVDFTKVYGKCCHARCCHDSGETEEQFQRTVALVREVGFDRVNTAAYSPRPNTPAAVEGDQV